MESIRRFGFVLFVFTIGMFIGHTSLLVSFLIFCPLFITWLILWDEQKYLTKTKKRYASMSESQHYH